MDSSRRADIFCGGAPPRDAFAVELHKTKPAPNMEAGSVFCDDRPFYWWDEFSPLSSQFGYMNNLQSIGPL